MDVLHFRSTHLFIKKFHSVLGILVMECEIKNILIDCLEKNDTDHISQEFS